MEENEDILEHVRKFFNKLNEMGIDINLDLLAIMLLYSLPPSFENFRCAIESRDELPSPEVAIKIIKESDARMGDVRTNTQKALIANKGNTRHRNQKKKTSEDDRSNSKDTFKYKCH